MAVERTRVKICGVRRVEDALVAAEAGADAVGLVFYAASPRALDAPAAAAICRALPPFVTPVGLFVDAEAEFVRAVLQQVPLGLLQFHGDEMPSFCGQFGRPYLKAIRMRDDIDLTVEAERFADAAALLLDTYRPGVPGGTGERFDWDRIPAALASRIVLAGGLTPANVGAAIAAVRPWAIDVSGGVEARPGAKDPALVRAFVAAAAGADLRGGVEQ